MTSILILTAIALLELLLWLAARQEVHERNQRLAFSARMLKRLSEDNTKLRWQCDQYKAAGDELRRLLKREVKP